MRSSVLDRSRFVTFGGMFFDAASANGMSFGDIVVPLHMGRNGVGYYSVIFDERIVPVNFLTVQGQSAGQMMIISSHIVGPGNITFLGGAPPNNAANFNFRFSIQALDKRR